MAFDLERAFALVAEVARMCSSVTIQNHNLSALAREGLSALDSGLRRDVLRRGLATAVPTLGAYLYMRFFRWKVLFRGQCR